MNKLIAAIKAALFGSNTVDGIVKSFNSHRAALEKLSGELAMHAENKSARALKLQAEAAKHNAEADRAKRVAGRVAELLR